MNKFILKLLLFIIPFITALLSLIYIDTFRLFRSYDSYYKDNIVTLNRGLVTARTYSKYRDKEKYNSFIFGSSRSLAFKCQEWVKYLKNDATPFHFDGSGDGIYAVSKKVQFIEEQGDSIKNALLIIDRDFLISTKNNEGHIFILPPEISKESKLIYYFTFFRAQIYFKFLIAYIDYSMFKTQRDYMGVLLRTDEYPHKINDINCDMWYSYDVHIKKDSLKYYNQLIDKGVFYNRPILKHDSCDITNPEISQLKQIKELFIRHNTKYIIVISPVYDMIHMEKEQLKLLYQIFGEENVYNFSGKNKFTEHISNYYDESHYKPPVANEILKIIYSD